MVFEKMCQLLCAQFGVEPEQITMEPALQEDLKADSLDLMEVTCRIEETFDVGEIREEDMAGLRTVGDLVRFVGEE